MTPSEYREFCLSTYAAPAHVDREEYLRLLLIEEVGEVASLFAKAMRDGHEVDRDRLKKELGDVMWATACLSDEIGYEVVGWGSRPIGIAGGRDYIIMWLLFAERLTGATHEQFAYALCSDCGFMPEDVALANVEKLKGRVARGTIHGSGDER